MPIAAMVRPGVTDQSVIYAIGRVDESGKVAAAQIVDRLGWETGDRLAVTIVRGVVVFQRDREGLLSVPKKRTLTIPSAARRACGISPGDTLMLAATAEFETILVHPPAVLDKMMTLYHGNGHGTE